MAKQRRLSKEQLNYVDELEQAVAQEQPGQLRFLPYIVLLLLVVFLLWAKFSIIEEITIAPGKVIPSGQIKKIQNLEGGILKEMFVSEGQYVKKGEKLAELDDTQFLSDYRQEQSKANNLMANIDRLQAEASSQQTITFRKSLQNEADVILQQQQLFAARKASLNKKIANIDSSIKFTERELTISRPLVKQGLLSKIELLQLERRANELQGVKIDEIRRFEQASLDERNRKISELAVVKEKLESLKYRLQRTTLVSPVRGIVKEIYITTRGGVIKPGSDIVDIVPLEASLVVEARVRPEDIAFIAPNLPVMIKVTAYDFTIYGGLEGKISYVSADSQEVEDKSYYDILVTTDKNYLGSKEKPLAIIPGMVVSAHIITGHRSILSYLLKPLLRAKHTALRER